MSYQELVEAFIRLPGVELSTMMGSPCLRFQGDFFAMMFEKEESLIIKVPPERVNQLISDGDGNEFNFTKKKFKEWVLIPLEFESRFESYLNEALAYAQSRHTRT